MIAEDQTQFEDEQSIRPFLLESETILWTGRPPSGLVFRKSDPLYLLFTLIFCGGGLVPLFMIYNRDQPESGLGFIILLGVLGLYLVSADSSMICWHVEKQSMLLQITGS